MISLAGSGDKNSGSGDSDSWFCGSKFCSSGLFCVSMDGVFVDSMFVKLVFGSMLGCVGSVFVASSSLNVCVIESCFNLLCSCVTYCNNLGLI